MIEGRPHSTYAHIFVVVRHDQTELERPLESCLSAVSVFSDHLEAENEDERLRQLRPDARSSYFVLPTRYKGQETSDG